MPAGGYVEPGLFHVEDSAPTRRIHNLVDATGLLKQLVQIKAEKTFAYDHRREGKDAHDLVYCLEHGEGAVDGAVSRFKEAMGGKHAEVIGATLAILSRRFCDSNPEERYLREGPVAVAQFEIESAGDDADIRERCALR